MFKLDFETRKNSMLNSAFEPWPSFTQAEADAVSKVLLSNKVNYWTGQECLEFEKEFCKFVDWNPLWAKPYVVLNRNGLKIAVIGVATDETLLKRSQKNRNDNSSRIKHSSYHQH